MPLMPWSQCHGFDAIVSMPLSQCHCLNAIILLPSSPDTGVEALALRYWLWGIEILSLRRWDTGVEALSARWNPHIHISPHQSIQMRSGIGNSTVSSSHFARVSWNSLRRFTIGCSTSFLRRRRLLYCAILVSTWVQSRFRWILQGRYRNRLTGLRRFDKSPSIPFRCSCTGSYAITRRLSRSACRTLRDCGADRNIG